MSSSRIADAAAVRRRRWRCPRRTSRARARRRPPAPPPRAGWPTPARRPGRAGRMRVVDDHARRASAAGGRGGARLSGRRPRPARDRQARDASRAAPPWESSSMPPDGEAAGGEHHGVGRERSASRGRVAHPDAARPARAPSDADGRRPQHQRRPRPRRSAPTSAALQAHARHRGRDRWGSRRPARRAAPAGRSHASRRACACPSTAGSSDGLARARSAGAARRPGGARSAGRPGRGRGPARPRRPSPGGPTTPISSGRARRPRRPRAGSARARLSARSAGIEVLQRAQPHRQRTAAAVAQVARRRSPAGARAVGRGDADRGRQQHVALRVARRSARSGDRARGTTRAPRPGARRRARAYGWSGRSPAQARERRAAVASTRLGGVPEHVDRARRQVQAPRRPSATTVTRAPALRPGGCRRRARRAPRRRRRRASYGPLGELAGRCSTSRVPWKIQSSRHAWRIWSP